MADNKINFDTKNLKLEDTDNPEIKFVTVYTGDRVTQPNLSSIPEEIVIHESPAKPKPKYSKKEILTIGDKKQVPDNWKTISDTTKFSENIGNVQSKLGAAPVPASDPGPCCMRDVYTHKTTRSFNLPYVWDAKAGGTNPITYAAVPQQLSSGLDYNIIPSLDGEVVNGVWSFSLESGHLDGPYSVSSNFPSGQPGDDASIQFDYLRDVTWKGATNIPFNRNILAASSSWAFPNYGGVGLFSFLSHTGASPGMQTQIDWSNSLTAYVDSAGSNVYERYWLFEDMWPDVIIEEYGAVPPYVLSPSIPIPLMNPFCQGRALINPGSPHYPNPWPGKSWAPGGSHPTGDGKIDKPRRMGWEGWVLRPHNVPWNWGNRGAWVDTLHYSLGCSEDLTSPSPPNTSNTVFKDRWDKYHQKADGISSFNLDGKTCSAGYCDYPMPGPISINGDLYSVPSNYFYKNPGIEGSQLEHQKICCSNSQWFQNARVLRNYDDETWNKIGSPYAGGNTGLTFASLGVIFDISSIVGTNGNGPPDGDPDARYSCTTEYTLNRILQYISSPSDFEEIQAKDFGTNVWGQDVLPYGKRMWFPVQAGYYNKNTGNINEDDPWENMYRLRDVGKFYAMINLCSQTANESLTLGTLGNLGNPPIAEIDLPTGISESKLNPGIWPWGHCITYACGNPEYSPNYDSGTTSSGNPQITYNKLGERGCEAQTPWANMPLNYYYSNVTFAGIKVWFYDEDIMGMTSKMFRKWSFSNSNEWSGQVPSSYEEASESAIGFMMWLGHNSWDYSMANPTAYPNSSQAGLYGPSTGRPAGLSGGTGIQYWDPVDADGFGNPITTGHFMYDLNNPTLKASTNGYFKGIRPNYTYLDVVTHLLTMEREWPIKFKNYWHDYDNRPTGVPEYNAGVPVSGTYKVNNPQTGIAYDWWNQTVTEPNGSPYFYENQYIAAGWCNYFPGEANANPWNNFPSPYGGTGQVLPPPTDPSWNGLKDGPGNPGGGNYCRQNYMLDSTYVTMSDNIPCNATTGGGCSNWTFPPGPIAKTVHRNDYIDACFKAGTVGTNYVSMPTPSSWNTCYKAGDVRGVFQNTTIGCVCFPWYSYKPYTEYMPQLITGPHCEGCNVGCCTDEFNSVFNTTCEYVYPQGLFKSKNDCKRAYAWESDTIPTSMVPAFIASQSLQTPFGRRKTKTSPLGDTTFCKFRPQGNPGCVNPHGLNYSPSHTEDCGGSNAWSYKNAWNISMGLAIYVDDSCCEFTKPGYVCDQTVDNDNDGMGDCLQACTYGNTPNTINFPPFGSVTIYTPFFENDGCYSAKTCTIPSDVCCEDNCGPYSPTSMPGYSCDYPNSNVGCAQNTIFSLVNPPTQAQLQTGGPYSSLTQCEQYNGGPGSPFCTPQSGYYCAGDGYLQPGLSILPYNPQAKVDGTDSNNSANFYQDGCIYTNSYYGPPPPTTTFSNSTYGNHTVPAGKLYPTHEECVADCYPCVDTDGVVYTTGSGSLTKDWCNAVKDELQNQFGNLWTEADLNSAQFADPNPTNPPSNYSPNYNSSWYSKYKNCCMGRISAVWKYNSIEEYALKQGSLGSNGSMYNSHGQPCCSGWQPPNLGFGFPLWGNQIRWWFTSPHWTCSIISSSQDLTGNYAGSFGTSSQSFEFVAGKGYRPKTTWPLGAGNYGPDGTCEEEEGKITGYPNSWNHWGTGVGYKT